MTDYPFADAILEQTNGGLQIIFDYYPEAQGCENNSSKTFKRRTEEKTASTTLKKFPDGTWGCVDWGAWDKPKNAISICMLEENLSYADACKFLAKLYNVEYKGKTHTVKPVYKTKPKTAQDKTGNYTYVYRDEIPKHELEVIGPKVTNAIAKRFHLKSVISYTFVTDKEVITLESTEDYPIFAYDFGSWVKRYRPKDEKKGRRFRYNGTRPKDYIFGLDDVNKAYANQKKEAEKVDEDNPFGTVDYKLDKIVICSGDRDALNMASFGYYVVWLNSETAKLEYDTFEKLRMMSHAVYNLPDIDKTGVQQGVELGLTYLDLKTIWLPKYLLQTKDWRGNPRKDFLDYLTLKYDPADPEGFNKRLKKLVDNALPMKFWDEVPDDKGMKYFYNIVHAEHFLKHQGFYRMETPFEKDEYCYIQLEGNVVKRTTPNKIENFVNNFLEARQMPIPLRNMVKKTPYLKEAMLSKLPVVEIDFKDCDARTQYWFFSKNVIEINQNEVKVHAHGVVDKMIMEEKVIEFPEKLGKRDFEEAFLQPPFKIFKDVDGDDDIEILDKHNPFLNYLINTSRIHWRKELEGDFFKGKSEQVREAYFKEHQFSISGPNLEPEEALEQKQHLINKIFALGYLLHKHKNKSKAWFVFGMDNKLSDIGESHGGSGKSLMYDYLQKIMKNQFFIPGRSKKAVDSEFLFDGVSKDTDYIFIDDMNQWFPFQQFFSEITGKMKVNPKGTSGYTIDFNDSPKLCGTSNFPPLNLDPSSTRRILFTVNSDYYHENKDHEYTQTRRVSDDFGGRNLFDDFTEMEYLKFYQFCAYAVKFYLGCPEKIGPPMDNVNKRNLMAEMGDAFRNWAFVYFSHENDKLDTFITRDEAFTDYQRVGNKKANAFKKAVEAFCKFNNYILNPKEVDKQSDGRIIHKVDGKSHEMFYIKTKDFNVTYSEENGDANPNINSKTQDDDSDGLFD